MSEAANTSSIILLDHSYNHHHPPPPSTGQLISPGGATTSTASPSREYRRGNWTLHETLVLITAKKLNDERRIKASSIPPDPNKPQLPNRTAELRWKWVENYCWNHDCHRSQNQCNDKWDNLLRDYKKIREYEARSDGSNDSPSYWKMEKHQRKERNLPSNLPVEVFKALNQVVVQHRFPQKTSTTLPQPQAAPPIPPPPLAASETSNSSDTVRSEKSESDPKRRKVESITIGSSIVESASVLARTLLNCEEKKEKRHRDVVEIEEQRIRVEEMQKEANRQGILNLISAVNNLSGAIEALVSDRVRAGD